MNYSKSNYDTCLMFQNFFPVFKSFALTDSGTLEYNGKTISLSNFDIREIYFETNNLFAISLKNNTLSASKIFNIFKMYENKNTYLEHEEDFYNHFGEDLPFIDKYNSYYYILLKNSDYLTKELQHFLSTFATRIMYIENNPSYADNPRLVKEVDFWNDSLLKLESDRDKDINGKSNTLRKSLKNSEVPTSSEYADEDVEEDFLSKTGYINIFLQVLLVLSIGIVIGSTLLIRIIS